MSTLACSLLSAATPTVAIKVDQAGYLLGAPKIAVIVGPGSHVGETAGRFVIRRSNDGSAAYQGSLSEPRLDPDSGDAVQQADFTVLHEKGRFYLDVPRVGRSWNFVVNTDVFNRVYYLAMRSYYGQRCGTAVDLGSEFPGFKHAACHLAGVYHESAGHTGAHESKQGWHDAGDYGRYVVNSGITTGTLLWAWELYSARISKIKLNLPESQNGIPDMLNEIRWNLAWMLTMQDADGGVWHKQTSTRFAKFVMPESDQLVSAVIGTGQDPFKSTCATADLAAVMAVAARVYKPFDANFSRQSLHAAESAWQWANAHPNVTFKNPPGVLTGEYGDGNCGDERLWAAAELTSTTRQPQYEDYFLQHYREYLTTIQSSNPPSWSMLGPLALWRYALSSSGNADAVNEIRKLSITAANEIVNRSNRNAYRISLTSSNYIWGSNGVVGSYGMQLLIADQFQSDHKYADTAQENLHYLLGRNTFSLSWVTQVGEHAFQHPHHRPSAADRIDLPWPGLLSGGPNPGRNDPEMKNALPPETLPAKSYIDDSGAYACNEVAINWNAPLVFALAALVQ